MDLNGDGLVSHDEFMATAHQLIFGDHTPDLGDIAVYDWFRHLWKSGDSNKDGFLTRDEMRELDIVTKSKLNIATAKMASSMMEIYDFAGDEIGRLASSKLVASIIEHSHPDEFEAPIEDFMDVVNQYLDFMESEHGTRIDARIRLWFLELFHLVDINGSETLDFGEVSLLRVVAGDALFRTHSGPHPYKGEGCSRCSGDLGVVNDGGKASSSSSLSATAELIADFDSDGDGLISEWEFMSVAAETETSRDAFERAKDLFAKADANKDGHLDTAEVERLLAHIHG